MRRDYSLWLRRLALLAVCLTTSTVSAAETAPVDPPPLSAVESMQQLEVREGFEVQLVAAEPLVLDPVAIDWGHDGRLWVVEMADYPSGLDGKGKPGGRVRWLEDSNCDGKYDKSVVFAEGINFPNGVLAWRKGVLVTAAPEILYFEDTTGDGRADVRRVLYSGFVEGNQQLRVNGLRWGIDNWVYCANGGVSARNNAKIKLVESGKTVAVGIRDFRIQPDQGTLDPQSGQAQFGRNCDDWGNWFGCMNSYPLWHVVLPDHYTRRNAHAAGPSPVRQLVLPRNPKIYPAKAPQKRFHGFEQSGRFTSACSANIYRDALLFPQDQTQHSFTCEPFHNLVHHEQLTDEGVSFHAQRAAEEKESEFLASKDRWFRPVMVRTGPDGGLWVCDMYRYMIEHPRWLPDTGKNALRPYYRSGDDRGRIYRIVRKGKPLRKVTQLSGRPAEAIVAALESPNGIVRDKAQQQIIWAQDREAIPHLKRLVATSKSSRTRMQALCTLDGLGALETPVLLQAARDEHPGVRRQAVRLMEEHQPNRDQLLAAVVGRATDHDAKVRLQVAFSLGAFDGPTVGPALVRVAAASDNEPYTTAAVLSSVTRENLDSTLAAAFATEATGQRPSRLLGQLVAIAPAMGDEKTLGRALDRLVQPQNETYAAWQLSAVADMLDTLTRRGISITKLKASLARDGKATSGQLDSMLQKARSIALSGEHSLAQRAAAVRLMNRGPRSGAGSDDVKQLASLLVPQTPGEVQQAVVLHLGRSQDKQVPKILLASWKSHGPRLRTEILNVILSRPAWLPNLLSQMENGTVSPADIDPINRQRMAKQRDARLRARVEKLLASSSNADRAKVVDQFAASLKLSGNPQAGAEVFKKKCSTCHKLGKVGHEIGPNLAALTNKKPLGLLVSILDPSRAVDARYVNYVAITDDGRTHSGVLVSETGNSITLLAAEGKKQVILRGELEALQSTGKSMMPDGLEKDMTPQAIADLLAFLGAK